MTVSPRTVLVFGAGGQVGRELIQRSPPAGIILHGLTHAEVDIADRVAIEAAVRRHQPNIIINAAAYTAVDKAETERERAFAVNETGPRIWPRLPVIAAPCSFISRLIMCSMAARPILMSRMIA